SSPQTKDAGVPPKLESTSVPSISRTAKCRVMRISGPARNGAVSLIAFLSCKQHIDDQQYRAEGDGAVSEVECREVRVAPVEIEEVDNVAMHDAIVQVAKRTAPHQRQRAGYQRFAPEAQQPHQHDDHRDDRHHRKEVTLPATGI